MSFRSGFTMMHGAEAARSAIELDLQYGGQHILGQIQADAIERANKDGTHGA